MTNEPAPLVPPMSERWQNEQDPTLRHYKYLTSHVDWEEWPGGAAEILSAYETAKGRAQTQAQRADEAEREASILRGEQAMNDEYVLREITKLCESFHHNGPGLRLHEAVNVAARLIATLAQRDREVLGLRQALRGHCQCESSDGLCPACEALATTAQAGAEAERRVLEAAWERLLAAFPPDGVEGEVVQGAKAAILGTGGEAVDLSKCPKCGGPADNGHDRCLPPNPYFCTKCESGEAR